MVIHVRRGSQARGKEDKDDRLGTHDQECDKDGIPGAKLLDPIIYQLEQATVVLLRPEKDSGQSG